MSAWPSAFAVVLALLAAAQLGAATIAERLSQYGPAARQRLRPHFASRGVAYPPNRITLVGIKSEARLHLYAGGSESSQSRLSSWPDKVRSSRKHPTAVIVSLVRSGGAPCRK